MQITRDYLTALPSFYGATSSGKFIYLELPSFTSSSTTHSLEWVMFRPNFRVSRGTFSLMTPVMLLPL